jgi:hypothetical protein
MAQIAFKDEREVEGYDCDCGHGNKHRLKVFRTNV